MYTIIDNFIFYYLLKLHPIFIVIFVFENQCINKLVNIYVTLQTLYTK